MTEHAKLTDNGGRPALGSATHGPHIFDIRQPWGGPRFYPPGEHPATCRLRAHRDWIAKLLNDHGMMASANPDAYRQACEALAHCASRLADFEAGEERAKAEAWWRLRDRLPPSPRSEARP